MKKIQIGIDPGVNTGIAVWDTEQKSFIAIQTLKIHEAMRIIEMTIQNNGKENVRVRFEDARLRTWFGKSGREQLQGAGSVKRDSKIWDDFLQDQGVEFQPVAPRANTTKTDQKQFQRITGYRERTSNHARDAAMLVFGF